MSPISEHTGRHRDRVSPARTLATSDVSLPRSHAHKAIISSAKQKRQPVSPALLLLLALYVDLKAHMWGSIVADTLLALDRYLCKH